MEHSNPQEGDETMVDKKAYIPISILLIIVTVLMVVCQPAFAADSKTSTAEYRVQPLREKLAGLTDIDIANSAKRFSDISKHWARTNIGKLTILGIINGMPDGTFKPDKAISADEYITMVVRALGYRLEQEGSYWAQVYIDKAVEDKIIDKDEIKNYKSPLSREHAAAIIVKALMQFETGPNSNIYDYIRSKIPDYPAISDKHKQYILQAYATGLFTGNSGGYFLPTNTLTRAEATTIILRLLDFSVRKPLKPTDSDVLKITDIYSGKIYEIYPSGNLDTFKTAVALNENIGKSKGYSFISYSPFAQTVSGSFYSSKEDFESYQNGELKVHMGFSINISDDPSVEFPYLITVYDSAKVAELHMDVISTVLKEIFTDDSDTAITLFEQYIKMSSDKSSVSDETKTISGRKIRIFKLEGDSVFSMWIYNR